jgi:hypothetical protein
MFIRILKMSLLLVIFSIRLSHGQAIQFVREKIIIEINHDHCELVGEYLFKNGADQLFQGSLFYPISKTHSPFPNFFKVSEARGKEITFTTGRGGIIFPICINAHDSTSYRVEYHQQTPDHFFEYILTTTKFWNRPLESVDFLISVPREFDMISLSMDYDKCIESEKCITYYFHREVFMPEKNLTLKWEVK